MQKGKPLISVCIASYNMGHLIEETIANCLTQDYPNIEVVVYDDCSTDNTPKLFKKPNRQIRYYRGKKNAGVGTAFNRAIRKARGKYVMIMCADDLIIRKNYISHSVGFLEKHPGYGHVTRWYIQFIDNINIPVRAWRTRNDVLQANNPSGLIFRKAALKGCKCSNKMFIETGALVRQVKNMGWGAQIFMEDIIAARVHGSTSTQKDYWLKRRVSSPVMDWWGLGVKEIAQDYVSLIQIKNGFTMEAVLEETWNFIKLRPKNLLNPRFWFFSLLSILTPRRILRKLPPFYRKYIGSKITGRK